MQDKLQQRLDSLKTEYDAGQKMLAELETKQANLRETLLRISGAIQVLEEMLVSDDDSAPADNTETEPPETEVV